MLNAKKIKTEHRQTARVVNALNLIWNNPDKSLDLAGIARACNVSKYHFHRIFHEYQGETLSSYITRKRLELVARRLLWYPNTSISEIAMNHGFSSPANFSKAFKKHFGITANEYRHPNSINSIKEGEIKSKYGIDLDPGSFYSKYKFLDEYTKKRRIKELDKIVSIVKLKEQKLMYRTINDGYNISSWLPMWNKVLKWGNNAIENWEEDVFTVWYDPANICPMHSARQDIAIRIPNSLEVRLPFMTQKIDAGYYATGILTGSESDLIEANRDIHTFWFMGHGIQPEQTPYYLQYLNKFFHDGFYKVRFYIKIKSRII